MIQDTSAQLEKLLIQYRSVDKEIARLDELAKSLPQERDELIASGRHDDPATVAAASTLNTKISMLPYKRTSLLELRNNVLQAFAPLVMTLRVTFEDESTPLLKEAFRAMQHEAAASLACLLPGKTDVIAQLSERVSSESLPVTVLSRITRYGDAEAGSWPEKAENLLLGFKLLEKARKIFFRGGDKLDVEAARRIEGFIFKP